MRVQSLAPNLQTQIWRCSCTLWAILSCCSYLFQSWKLLQSDNFCVICLSDLPLCREDEQFNWLTMSKKSKKCQRLFDLTWNLLWTKLEPPFDSFVFRVYCLFVITSVISIVKLHCHRLKGEKKCAKDMMQQFVVVLLKMESPQTEWPDQFFHVVPTGAGKCCLSGCLFKTKHCRL